MLSKEELFDYFITKLNSETPKAFSYQYKNDEYKPSHYTFKGDLTFYIREGNLLRLYFYDNEDTNKMFGYCYPLNSIDKTSLKIILDLFK